MNPSLKLDDVDVMVYSGVLLSLLAVAGQSYKKILQSQRAHGSALDMALVNNTLVIKRRTKPSRPQPLTSFDEWDFFRAATNPVPAVGDSSQHYRLLRYNIGPLSCVVRTQANGTIQKMPVPRDSSGLQETRHIHGIDVIAGGEGILTDAAFAGSARQRPGPHTRKTQEAVRLKKMAARLWFSGLTKLGVADSVAPGEDAGAGGLTVVEMGELVRHFETENAESLRRLASLLAALRDTVRDHGGPCIALNYFPTHGPHKYTVHVHSAGPEEAPVLLDWHLSSAQRSNRHRKRSRPPFHPHSLRTPHPQAPNRPLPHPFRLSPSPPPSPGKDLLRRTPLTAAARSRYPCAS